MNTGVFVIPDPVNEPLNSYAPGTPEREILLEEVRRAMAEEREICMTIGGKKVKTDDRRRLFPPHKIDHTLGYYYQGNKEHVQMAVEAALEAKKMWETFAWEERTAIFLRAADLLAGPYRMKINAATMLGQSKNPHQAEIDSAAELIDFLRFNAKFTEEIYSIQPVSVRGVWNKTDWRPLEGFVFALTPFNFTAIAGNLPTAPAMLGNTVVWKPSKSQIYSAAVIMEVLQAAGLPDGVINLVFTSGPDAVDVVLNHRAFGGIHFTGSTGVFNSIWKTIGENLSTYRCYPRIVGETGGKDFVVAHSSANVDVLATALVRGAFEYQGQKCSAVSRAYIPESLWPAVKDKVCRDLKTIKMGPPDDFSNYINAVIDEKSFDKLSAVIDKARKDKDVEIICGGEYDKSEGFYISPTVLQAKVPNYYTMEEELFGPILTVFVYPDKDFEGILHTCNKTSLYGLTGGIISRDRKAIQLASEILRYSAGNFYINDKPTGAVVGQQPFGGARSSGTNDKAGSMLNMLRWVSPRSLKENFDPPKDFSYPFLH